MLLLRTLFAALAILVAGGVPAAAEQPVRVFAASSLTEVLNDIADAYARTGRPRPLLAFAASSALARQIEQGAPADLFVSADQEWMDYLADRKLVALASRRTLASNRLVLVVPAGRARRIPIGKSFDMLPLVGDGRWVTGDPDSVPVGRYARTALERLGAWERASTRLARAENVRSALAFVERGDAAAGIVYATDAAASGKVAVAGTFPAWSHPKIVYPAALTAGAQAEARAFHVFLRSRAARALLVRRGFLLP
jgi:molybdate transport system substrate-binding protein